MKPGDNLLDFPSKFTSEQIFNRFCRRIEREIITKPFIENKHAAEIISISTKLMDEASVFYLDHSGIRRVAEYCKKNPIDLMEMPYPVLPFNEIIIATPYNAYLLFDIETTESPDKDGWIQNGVPVAWRCKFWSLHQEDDGWALSVGMIKLGIPAAYHQNARQIMVVNTTVVTGNSEDGDSNRSIHLDNLKFQDPEYHEQLSGVITQTVSMVFDTCNYIDAPCHHLVIETPSAFDPTKRRAKIPRANDRPRVRIIEPEAVRRIYPHLPGADGGGTVTPHARRGHTRLMTSERFKEARGRRIVVRPTWVGDTEWKNGQTKYKVVYRGKN